MTIAEVKARVLASAAYWLSVYGQILNDLRQVVTPELNIYQIRMCQAVEWARAHKIPVRIIGLKPRQVGGTTIACAIIYWMGRKIALNLVLIADILDRSKKMFIMYRRFAQTDRYPDWGSTFTATEKTIEFTNKSRAEMKTAENPTGSRADTLQALLASELPYWPQDGERSAEATLLSLEGSLADHPDTIEIIESTANGSFGVFPERFRAAHWPVYDDYAKFYARQMPDGVDGNAFIRVFAGWFEFEKHRRPVTGEQIASMRESLSARERRGIDLYNWTWEQIAWRRWCLENKCGGKERQLDQEYPEDPVSCFLASGNPRFSDEGTAYLESVARQTRWRVGILTEPQRGRGGRPTFIPTGDSEAWLRILEEPKIGCRYIIPGDVSSDRDVSPQGSQDAERDKHSFGVMREAYTDHRGIFYRRKLVARLQFDCEDGHRILTWKIKMMSLYYGGCVVAPEMNNHGLALATKLIEADVPLLKRKWIDPKTENEKEIVGWETNKVTKPLIIGDLADAIRDVASERKTSGLEVFCEHACSELATYEKKRDGTTGAAEGSHDDDVMMLAIGNYLLPNATLFEREAPVPHHEVDSYREVEDARSQRSSVKGLPLR